MNDPGKPTHVGLLGELDVSPDTCYVYVYMGIGDNGQPDWAYWGYDLKILRAHVDDFQAKHDYMSDEAQEELYSLTNIVLYLEERYKQKSVAPQSTVTKVKIPRF
jgi:hypothetical protein